MGPFEIFVIRALLAGIFAFFIVRFFFQTTALVRVLSLALLMLGVSYFLEYLRNRNSGGTHES